MTSTMWKSLDSADPSAMLNNQLAAALSTIGDAQYWEESISPATIRQSMVEADPSNPAHTHTFLRAMKWLLASISKGRNVSDFYPHVVKSVGVHSLEVRKMVYVYLVQYANHDATTRELSLLSINSFQRGLADAEPLIRALALRVLTSITIADILQIQILAVQKCSHDKSPYVRKCAANAIAKLSPRCEDQGQRQVLLDMMQTLLDKDDSTMVLSSAIVAFAELCPVELDRLHGSFHKICHLLTDMDEWGQVIAIDTLARYCRTFFKEPVGWKEGTAERIDRERRVRRTTVGVTATLAAASDATSLSVTSGKGVEGVVELPPRTNGPRKIKRRVVRKGFYSDEEDESTEEEIFADDLVASTQPLSIALRQGPAGLGAVGQSLPGQPALYAEDSELAEDHRILLQSAMPLLKSRNAGVVLAVCSLQYYCGVSSVPVRAAIGKALVRIHREKREIQYVVLSSIRTLVTQCPSAFSPFLPDFFVKAMDPPFTKIIKLDILTSLALEPSAIETVLKELGSYARQGGDKEFTIATIRAVGRVVEMARFVHDRHGSSTENAGRERSRANHIALTSLAGLLTTTQTLTDRPLVVGAAVQVMRCILQMLWSDEAQKPVEDIHQIQHNAIRRILLLLAFSLAKKSLTEEELEASKQSDDVDDKDVWITKLEGAGSVVLPPESTASALWIAGEYLSRKTASYTMMREGILRLLRRAFCDLEACEKEQALRYASKIYVAFGQHYDVLCEQIIAMGRVDVNPSVRDQARLNSGLVHLTSGLKHDLDSFESVPVGLDTKGTSFTQCFISIPKPPPSSLPVEDEDKDTVRGFRFGTLSSLVGHRARSAYLPLPPWAKEDSPSSLRSQKSQLGRPELSVPQATNGQPASQFYDSNSSGKGSDSESSSSSSSDDESEKSGSSSFSSSTSSADGEVPQREAMLVPVQESAFPGKQKLKSGGSDEDESSFSSAESSSTDNNDDSGSSGVGNLIPVGGGQSAPSRSLYSPVQSSSIVDDLKGLVVAPIAVPAAVQPSDSNFERDSGAWIQLVRPDHSGGLSVKARYLRGPTKAKEVEMLGLTLGKASVICVQLRYENEKKDIPFRRICVLQRSGSASTSVIKPGRLVPPPAVELLSPGQRVDCILGIDFSGVSDRDGSLVARLDIKFGSGGIPVELKPSIGDLLGPLNRSVVDFNSACQRLQGFQRVESAFPIGSVSRAETLKRVMEVAALTLVGEDSDDWKEPLRLVGALPASGDPVYVQVMVQGDGICKIIICCDHALVVSSVMNLIKRAMQNS